MNQLVPLKFAWGGKSFMTELAGIFFLKLLFQHCQLEGNKVKKFGSIIKFVSLPHFKDIDCELFDINHVFR